MKKVGILPNIEKDKDWSVTKCLAEYLKQHGCTVLLPENAASQCTFPAMLEQEECLFQKADFIICLGGDGTILGVGRKSAPYGTPILGINLGHLGFLTAVEKNEAEVAINKVLSGEYKLEKRMLLTAHVVGEETDQLIALNDICVTRGAESRLLEFRIMINGDYVDTVRADGIIICTPTGSTAYNLAAGGPVIKADAQIIAITPICAHTLTSRPIVISAEDEVEVEVTPKGETIYSITADGQESKDLQGVHSFRIGKSAYFATIIKTSQQSFYDVLRHKLSR